MEQGPKWPECSMRTQQEERDKCSPAAWPGWSHESTEQFHNQTRLLTEFWYCKRHKQELKDTDFPQRSFTSQEHFWNIQDCYLIRVRSASECACFWSNISKLRQQTSDWAPSAMKEQEKGTEQMNLAHLPGNYCAVKHEIATVTKGGKIFQTH